MSTLKSTFPSKSTFKSAQKSTFKSTFGSSESTSNLLNLFFPGQHDGQASEVFLQAAAEADAAYQDSAGGVGHDHRGDGHDHRDHCGDHRGGGHDDHGRIVGRDHDVENEDDIGDDYIRVSMLSCN